MRIGINGMGRIGRLVLRAALGGAHRPADDPRRDGRLDIVQVNEARGGAATCAHLLEFDSVQGRWRGPAISAAREDAIAIGDRTICFTRQTDPAAIDWAATGAELILDCTGKFLTPAALEGHFARGARRVLVAAPVKDPAALNVVMGVNDASYDPAAHRIVTAASCTTNCLAPVVSVLHAAIGISHGQITTIHAPTNTNGIVDAAHRDLRRARSAMLSLQPTTTGSATAIGLIIPDLAGRLNGHAVRAPILNASLTDCVFEMRRATDAREINDALRAASRGPLAGILGVEERPLVSADFAQDTRSSIVDAPSTLVTAGTMAKVYAWYDNEMGYACRMVDLARLIAAREPAR